MTDVRLPHPALGPLHPRLPLDEAAASPPEAPSPDLVRRVQALAKWRKRSRQVRFFRKALPVAIAAILLFGVCWVGVRAIIATMAHIDRGLGSIHLIHPTFYGRNEKGELYIMSAAQAVRDGDDPDRITLVSPDLKQYPTGAPAPITTHALHGVYHEQHKLLDLFGHVVATDGRGYTFESEAAHVDMVKNSAVGDTHVNSYGPSGSVTADAYQVYDKGQHVIFTGHVHTHLTNASTPKPVARPAAQPVLPSGALPAPFRISPGGAPDLRSPL